MGAVSIARDGGAQTDVRSITRHACVLVPCTITMSNSYATGGDTITLSAGLKGHQLREVLLQDTFDGTRAYDARRVAAGDYRIRARTAFATEVTAATDLSAVKLNALLVLER